jgi:NAD(P)-dependent dehydrogenase (short-subunit alcohol dehydrogenase family)
MDGQIAIVTGGGGRIGVGVCRALAKAGATVVALDLDPSRAAPDARPVVCDVTDSEACAQAVSRVVGEFGGIDTLVQLAQRFAPLLPLADVTLEHMQLSFDSGPNATLRMMQLCYPHLKARGGGAIINFASGVGTQGLAGYGAYAAAKEAIRGLTKVAAIEWGDDNIRVNAICPFASDDPTRPEFTNTTVMRPIKRVGHPETDIGATVVFLAGPGSYITGRTLHVDGGAGTWR